MSEIKRIQYLAAVAIVALVLISVFAVSRPIPRTSKNTSKTIQVSGVGTASATPDEVLLRLAVYTQSATATQATQDNAVAMASVFKALGNLGLGRNSIATISYSLTPILNSSNSQRSPSKVVGYTARNDIQITLANVNMTGIVLDAAVTAGANEVLGITFTFTSQTYAALQKQALQLAVQNAAGQAQTMASSMGVHIIGPLTVTTGYYSQPTVERLAVNAQTPIQPGTLQVTANVQVTYEVA
jgi:hypothetical protein